MKKKIKRMLSGLLVFMLLLSNVTYVEAADSGNTKKVYRVLKGSLLAMGYEFGEEPKIISNTTLWVKAVCEEDNTFIMTKTHTGTYEIKLEEGKEYSITYHAKIPSRRKNLHVTIPDPHTGEMHVVVRSKTVRGMEKENKFLEKYPEPRIVERELNYESLDNEVLQVEPETCKLAVNETKQLSVSTVSGLKSALGYEYTSSDDSIASVDKNGVVTAHKNGTTNITCKIPEIEEGSVECKVNVATRGFDARVDGYCFANSYQGFDYDLYVNEYKKDFKKYSDRVMKTWNKKSQEYDYDYFIPYERYREIYTDCTSNMYEKHYKEAWGGNCFGMSLTAILFYYGCLDVNDYAPDMYDDGETVNKGMYQRIRTSDSDSTYEATAEYDSELTKLIERYMAWQDSLECDDWKMSAITPIEDVIENWETKKPYYISLKFQKEEENTITGHGVVLDTTGEAPKLNEKGEYVFKIYDPNGPKFTDKIEDRGEMSHYYKDADQSIMIKLNEKGEAEYFLYEFPKDSEDSMSRYWVGKSISFMDLQDTNVPLDFSKKTKITNIAGQLIYLISTLLSDDFSISQKSASGNKVLFSVENGEITHQAEGIDVYSDFTYGDTTTQKYHISGLPQDAEINMENGGKVAVLTPDSIQGVTMDKGGVIGFSNDKVSVQTREESEVSVLVENHREDGTITSVLSEGTSKANNVIQCSMDAQDNYNMTATEEMQTKLTLNTEDADVNVTAGYKASEAQTPVEITHYMEENANKQEPEKDTNPPINTSKNPGTAVPSDKPANETKTPGATTTVNKQSEKVDIVLNNQILKGTLKARVGKTYKLQAIVSPENVAPENAAVTWKSSNEKVAKVSDNGKLSIKKKGTVEITAETADGQKQTITFKAGKKPVKAKKIILNGKKTIKVNKSQVLKATVLPATADNQKVTWTSSDKKIATVNSKGKVTAKKKGTVKITAMAKDGSKTKAVFKIKIK